MELDARVAAGVHLRARPTSPPTPPTRTAPPRDRTVSAPLTCHAPTVTSPPAVATSASCAKRLSTSNAPRACARRRGDRRAYRRANRRRPCRGPRRRRASPRANRRRSWTPPSSPRARSRTSRCRRRCRRKPGGFRRGLDGDVAAAAHGVDAAERGGTAHRIGEAPEGGGGGGGGAGRAEGSSSSSSERVRGGRIAVGARDRRSGESRDSLGGGDDDANVARLGAPRGVDGGRGRRGRRSRRGRGVPPRVDGHGLVRRSGLDGDVRGPHRGSRLRRGDAQRRPDADVERGGQRRGVRRRPGRGVVGGRERPRGGRGAGRAAIESARERRRRVARAAPSGRERRGQHDRSRAEGVARGEMVAPAVPKADAPSARPAIEMSRGRLRGYRREVPEARNDLSVRLVSKSAAPVPFSPAPPCRWRAPRR